MQELLGHSNVSTMMNVYAHATRKAKRTSAKLLDKVATIKYFKPFNIPTTIPTYDGKPHTLRQLLISIRIPGLFLIRSHLPDIPHTAEDIKRQPLRPEADKYREPPARGPEILRKTDTADSQRLPRQTPV